MPATTLDPRTALVVIDLQQGLAQVPTLRPFQEVVAKSAQLAEAFRRAQLPVVLVTTAFAADGADQPHSRTDVPLRRFPATPEFYRLVPELTPAPGDILITKRQPNAFYGTELDLQLRRRQITGIVLTGVVTSNGVDSTARAGHERAYNITFASDAITDRDAASHELVMTKIFPRLGEVDTTDVIVALLGR